LLPLLNDSQGCCFFSLVGFLPAGTHVNEPAKQVEPERRSERYGKRGNQYPRQFHQPAGEIIRHQVLHARIRIPPQRYLELFQFLPYLDDIRFFPCSRLLFHSFFSFGDDGLPEGGILEERIGDNEGIHIDNGAGNECYRQDNRLGFSLVPSRRRTTFQ